MRETLEDVVRAVARTLEEDVLPALEPRSWPASRVRSSLSLLQHVVDRAAGERRMLIETNALMRAFLDGVASGSIATPKGWPTVRSLDFTEFADLARGAETTQLARANEAYKDALGRLARDAAVARKTAPAGADTPFRQALHALLMQLHEADRVLMKRATELLPI